MWCNFKEKGRKQRPHPDDSHKTAHNLPIQFSPAHQRAETSRWTTNLPRQREAAPRMDVFTQCRRCWMLVRNNPEFLANGKKAECGQTRDYKTWGAPDRRWIHTQVLPTGPPQVLTSKTSQSPETACPWVQAWGVRSGTCRKHEIPPEPSASSSTVGQKHSIAERKAKTLSSLEYGWKATAAGNVCQYG